MATLDTRALYPGTRTAVGVPAFEDLGPEEYRQFDELGYFVIEQAFSQDEIAVASEALDAMLRGENAACNEAEGRQFEPGLNEPPEDGDVSMRVRKIMSPVDYDARLRALAEHPKLIAMVSRLVNDTPLLFQSMALVKPPKHGSEKPWHQDLAYFNYPPDMPVAGCWIAIDEATRENGCMHIVPGSHRRGPMPHFRRRDWQICDSDMDVSEDTIAPLKPGGMLVFSGMLQHGTPDNHSEKRRRSLQYHYRPASATAISEEERLQIYGGEGRGATC